MPLCAGCQTEIAEGGVFQENGTVLCGACDVTINGPPIIAAAPPDAQKRSLGAKLQALRLRHRKNKPDKPQVETLIPDTFTPWATYWIAFANGIVFFISCIFIGSEAFWPSAEALRRVGGNYGPNTVLDGEYWRILTSTLLHAGPLHLLFNAYALLWMGPAAEYFFGWRRYVILYLCAGLAGSMASLWWNPAIVSVGASGAIFGVFGALIAFFEQDRSQYKPELVEKYKSSISIFAIYSLVNGLTTDGIDNAAHVGGFAAGFFLGLSLAPKSTGKMSASLVIGTGLFIAVMTLAQYYLPWRVNQSGAVQLMAKASQFNNYVNDSIKLLEAQDDLNKQVMNPEEQPVSEMQARARENLSALRLLVISNDEIRELHDLIIKRGEAIVAIADKLNPPSSEAELMQRKIECSKATQAVSNKMSEIVSRYKESLRNR
jgi:membrane associated rhomboid family serine protease